MYLISTVLIHIRNISEANIKYAIPQSYNDMRYYIMKQDIYKDTGY